MSGTRISEVGERPGRTGWMVLVMLVAMGLAIPPETAQGCFAVVVGREASADGAVLLGHNEQSGCQRLTSLRVVPARTYARAGDVTLLGGATLPRAAATGRVLWSHVPEQMFSDNFLNEWGVAVVSDGCPTREDGYDALVARGEIRDGGIGYMLRRLVALRAHSAREGVELAGHLLDRFGYVDSGRTLVIADPREAWLLSIVRGRHWVAQRVPDDGVAILPNVHIITAVDLADSARFRGSPDLVEYAVSRGWFHGDAGGSFSFRAAYNRYDGRDPRQWRGQCLVAAAQRHWPAHRPLPFSVVPDHRLSVADVAAILRHHGPEEMPLCTAVTEEGAVFQLRDWLPADIGAVYWRISAEPCLGLLVPWYAGIRETPPSYYEPISVETQLDPVTLFQQRSTAAMPRADLAWWTFLRVRDLVHADYDRRITRVQAVAQAFEAPLFAQQRAVEAQALALYEQDPRTAASFLTEYSQRIGVQAQVLAGRIALAMEADTPLPVVPRGDSSPAPGAAAGGSRISPPSSE